MSDRQRMNLFTTGPDDPTEDLIFSLTYFRLHYQGP